MVRIDRSSLNEPPSIPRYTVVGVPDEAFWNGWLALRWAPALSFVALGCIVAGPRLRRTALVRNHQSPVDFVTDRFRSQVLRYTVALLQVFPAVVCLTAQCTAIRTVFNSILGVDAGSPYAVLGASAAILVFEWSGGLHCVAFTDAVQGTVMALCFVVLPIVVATSFGGWDSLDWRTYPRPSFYQTPSMEDQGLFWSFSISNVAFFTLPHMLQRTYAASSTRALKIGYRTLAISPWLTVIPGVFLGTVGVQMLADKGEDLFPSSPLASILTNVLDQGGFAYATFYQTPSMEDQGLFWSFSISNVAFFTLPHMLQRTYAASSTRALKIGYRTLAISPWLTVIPGVFLGTVGVQMLADKGEDLFPSSPLASILTNVLDQGGFAYAIGVVATTATLAAIMSTADSLLISVSHLITCEVVYPLLPDASPRLMRILGGVISLWSLTVALCASLFANQGILDLAAMQFGLSLQILPTFLVGLFANEYTECSPWVLSMGIWCGSLSVFFIQFLFNDGGVPLDSGLVGCSVNVVVCVVAEIIYRLCWGGEEVEIQLGLDKVQSTVSSEEFENEPTFQAQQQPQGPMDMIPAAFGSASGTRGEGPMNYWPPRPSPPPPLFEPSVGQPMWDVPQLKRFGTRPLTHDLISRIMMGVPEPLIQPWFPSLVIVLSLLVAPFGASSLPPLLEGYDDDGAHALRLAYDPGTMGGVPIWAVRVLAGVALMTIALLAAINKIPDEFPDHHLTRGEVEERWREGLSLKTESVAAARELSPRQLRQRNAYDEPNWMARVDQATTPLASSVVTKAFFKEGDDSIIKEDKTMRVIHENQTIIVEQASTTSSAILNPI